MPTNKKKTPRNKVYETARDSIYTHLDGVFDKYKKTAVDGLADSLCDGNNVFRVLDVVVGRLQDGGVNGCVNSDEQALGRDIDKLVRAYLRLGKRKRDKTAA